MTEGKKPPKLSDNLGVRAVRPADDPTLEERLHVQDLSLPVVQWRSSRKSPKFYVSLLPKLPGREIQRNQIDSPAGKAGSVLVVRFTLAVQGA